MGANVPTHGLSVNLPLADASSFCHAGQCPVPSLSRAARSKGACVLSQFLPTLLATISWAYLMLDFLGHSFFWSPLLHLISLVQKFVGISTLLTASFSDSGFVFI